MHITINTGDEIPQELEKMDTQSMDDQGVIFELTSTETPNTHNITATGRVRILTHGIVAERRLKLEDTLQERSWQLIREEEQKYGL